MKSWPSRKPALDTAGPAPPKRGPSLFAHSRSAKGGIHHSPPDGFPPARAWHSGVSFIVESSYAGHLRSHHYRRRSQRAVAAAFYAGFRTMKVKIIDSLEELGGQVTALYPEKDIFDVAGFPKVSGKGLVEGLRAAGIAV